MGCSLGFDPGMPLPSIAGWLMPSLNPKASCVGGQRVTIQAPDGGDPVEFLVRRPGAREYTLKPRRVGGERAEPDVDIRGAERLLPILGGTLTNIPELCRTRRHALLERQRKAVERVLRNTQRLEALERESGADPRLAGSDQPGSWRRRARESAAVAAHDRRAGRRCGAEYRHRRTARAGGVRLRSGYRPIRARQALLLVPWMRSSP